jgi:hypothetical protein
LPPWAPRPSAEAAGTANVSGAPSREGGIDELPAALRRELAVIAASQGVHEDSARSAGGGDGTFVISFAIDTETLVEPRDSGIEPTEPINFLYESIDAVGVQSPAVISAREDFPRNFPHLNPVPPGAPVSLCLARSGLQHVYDRYGVEGVMTRLRAWLRDAQTGGLSTDGWHPVPYSPAMPARPGLLDAAALQELAAARRSERGYAAGVAKITAPEQGDYVFINSSVLSAAQPAHNSELSKAVSAQKDSSGRLVGVPWILVWPSDDKPISDPVFGFWTTCGDMLRGLKAISLSDFLQETIGAVLANGCTCKHAPGRQTFVVLVGIWRPVPLAENIFGLSTDPVARRLEIKAFTLEAPLTGNLLLDDTPLRAIVADPMPGPALFRWVSGLPALGMPALIGYGALGSALATHLLRAGAEYIVAFDGDTVRPHNLARHAAEVRDVYGPKVTHLDRAAGAITLTNLKPKLRLCPEDVLKLPDQELAERLDGVRLIIDSTADERVRGRLARFSVRVGGRQIVRTEIYHRGRLGVQLVTAATGEPGPLELYYTLCREALSDEAVAQWLYDEHLAGPEDDELLFGFGCSSMTTRLPGYVIAQHAAAFIPTIVEALGAGAPTGIGLNRLDAAFRPAGWSWVDVPPFRNFAPQTAPGWSVRVHPDAADFMTAQRAKAAPNETGGYLYGGWDLSLKTIIIVAASDLPPGSTASVTGLELGLAGNTVCERRIALRTRGRLQLCGSWHSHPGQSAALSRKDEATMAKFRADDLQRGVPTLFLVVAEAGLSAHLEC